MPILILCLDHFFTAEFDLKIKGIKNIKKKCLKLPNEFINTWKNSIYTRNGIIYYLLGQNHFIAKVSRPKRFKLSDEFKGWFMHDGLKSSLCFSTKMPTDV